MKANSLEELVTNSNIVNELHIYSDKHTRLVKFAQLVADWQKERDEMSKVNYEGARAVYDNTVQHLQEKIDEKYELGKKDMKQQMLKDAIPFYEILKAVPSFERENTRIIIVKEGEYDD